MMYLRKLIIGCVLIFAVYIPLNVNAQDLTITGKGQLTVRADEVCDAIPIMMQFLPIYKPNTKCITITDYFLYNDTGELKRYSRDGVNRITIQYDEQGRITNLNDVTFHYEDNRIIECSRKDGFRCRFKYDSKGHLESATKGSWTYKFNVDKKGNIIGVYVYYGTRKTSEISMSYDAKDRIIAYSSNYRDYIWNYNKTGQLVSRREIGYSFSQGKVGGKTSEKECEFEYGEDGNPVRRIDYVHGDITVLSGGSEYSYEYTFYPDPKEQERKEVLKKRERIRRDSIQLVNQRKNDSINLEKQRKESLRQERNKELFQVCKFLFDSDEEYESSVVKKNDLVEQDIKGHVVKKLQYIYPLVLNGKELRKEKQPGRNELVQICNMCAQLNIVKSQCDNEEIEIISHICDYAESKLGDFVSGRSALNKAYKKTSNKSYSSFLLLYMNDK